MATPTPCVPTKSTVRRLPSKQERQDCRSQILQATTELAISAQEYTQNNRGEKLTLELFR